MLTGERQCFLLRLEARQRCPFSSLVFNIAQKDLALAIGQKKKMRACRLERNRTILIFRWHHFYVENTKESTPKLLELISELSSVTRYRVNTEKSIVFYLLATNTWKPKFKNAIPFTTE